MIYKFASRDLVLVKKPARYTGYEHINSASWALYKNADGVGSGQVVNHKYFYDGKYFKQKNMRLSSLNLKQACDDMFLHYNYK